MCMYVYVYMYNICMYVQYMYVQYVCTDLSCTDAAASDEWDCIATCFFIDTAHNVIEYLEKIYHILKPGGYWINIGKQ